MSGDCCVVAVPDQLQHFADLNPGWCFSAACFPEKIKGAGSLFLAFELSRGGSARVLLQELHSDAVQ